MDTPEVNIVQETSKPPCHDEEPVASEDSTSSSNMCDCNDCNQAYDQTSFEVQSKTQVTTLHTPFDSKVIFKPPHNLDHPPNSYS